MAPLPAALRQGVRWLALVLRSVPELVWALVWVRVVGLGPAAGVLAIALTYSGMLGKVYADILESGDTHATTSLLRNGSGRLQATLLRAAAQQRGRTHQLHRVPLECAIRSSARCWALWVQAAWVSSWTDP